MGRLSSSHTRDAREHFRQNWASLRSRFQCGSTRLRMKIHPYDTHTRARHQTAYGERMRKSGGTSKYETRPPFGAPGCSKNIRFSAKQIPSKTGPRGFGCRWVVGLGRPHRERNVNKTVARSRYIAVCAVIFEQFNLLTNQLRLPALGRSFNLVYVCVFVCGIHKLKYMIVRSNKTKQNCKEKNHDYSHDSPAKTHSISVCMLHSDILQNHIC